MTTAITSDIGLLSTYVIAQAKLPDDLAFSEYDAVVRSLRAVSEDARLRGLQRVAFKPLGAPKGNPPTFQRVLPPEPEVVRVQYGSDFVLVLSILGSAPALAAAFLTAAKGLKIVQESRKINEERLGLREDRLLKKEQRLERNAERAKAVAAYKSASQPRTELIESEIRERQRIERQALDTVMDRSERAQFDQEVGAQRFATDTVDLYAAADTLAEYKVRVRVENDF